MFHNISFTFLFINLSDYFNLSGRILNWEKDFVILSKNDFFSSKVTIGGIFDHFIFSNHSQI